MSFGDISSHRLENFDEDFEDDNNLITRAGDLKTNFVYFSLFYSIVHASVDSVLAYATAELGKSLGAYGGFTLYIFYTFSALLLAKPFLSFFDSKFCVLCGLLGTLFYVCGFFVSIIFPALSWYIFISGAAIGGMGAGLLWTAQGAYYSINTEEYSKLNNENRIEVSHTLAAIFAGLYLGSDAIFKFFATIWYVIQEKTENTFSWKILLFGFYTLLALISTILFKMRILKLNSKDIPPIHSYENLLFDISLQVFSVSNYILKVRNLQLLLPFQVTFGFAAGMVNGYMNGVVVKDSLGDGYIGLFSGLITLIAALIAYPCEYYSNKYKNGALHIIILGASLFGFNGFMVSLMPKYIISNIACILLFYLSFGIARGIWENTNKAIVNNLFVIPDAKEGAFASIYFASGLSGALGFLFFRYLSHETIGLISIICSVISIICFFFLYKINKGDLYSEGSKHQMSRLSTSDEE